MFRTFLFAALLVSPFAQTVVVAEETPIKVTTYNIRYANPGDGEDVWPNRRQFVIAYASGSDIIGMQEVTAPQFEDLREGLPEFGSYGVGRDDGKSGGEHAPIFYRKARFELIDNGTFWLSESPNTVGKKGWDAALPRTCTWVNLRDRRSGREIFVANTHFDHRGAKARAESGKLIVRQFSRVPADRPTVVMGDFNCLPDSEPYNAIASSFTDARLTSESKPTGPSSTWNGFREIVPDRIIDHIFVRSIRVLKLSTDDPRTANGRFASDHLPVQMVVQLGESVEQ